MPNRRSFLKA
jgi:hypothetical protein